MLTAIITLPENFVSTITATVGQLFTDLSPYITLILGVLLGTLVISIVINTLHK
jgi:type II secretory pathway component PulF